MPAYTINPNNAGTFTIALDGITPLVAYSCQITDIRLEPTGATQEVPDTYCDGSFDEPDGLSKWSMQLAFLQDWGNTPSLSEFSNTNDGMLCDFSFVPTNPDGVPTATGQVYVQATPFGGPPNVAWQTGERGWPLKGAPTFTPAVLLLAADDADDNDLVDA